MIIQSISEAFSMQPAAWSVHHKNQKRSASNPEEDIKEIYYQKNSDGIGFYIGYNFEGQMLFKYLALSVNVHYKTSKP